MPAAADTTMTLPGSLLGFARASEAATMTFASVVRTPNSWCSPSCRADQSEPALQEPVQNRASSTTAGLWR